MDGRLTIAVIPARHHATRFPGKPLALIDGVPMVVRVADRVRESQAIDDVWVATDDDRIAEVARRAGCVAVMTDPGCASGTDRVARALAARRESAPALVINVQGDEPLIDSRDLDRLVHNARERPEGIVTLARRSCDPSDATDPNRVKVAMTAAGRALYFSRAPIPHGSPTILHVGVYAFTPAILQQWVGTAPTALEQAERLEQLRALELGIPIHVTMCEGDGPSLGVDVPADVARVEAALRVRRGTT